jgi:hypothetical protein
MSNFQFLRSPSGAIDNTCGMGEFISPAYSTKTRVGGDLVRNRNDVAPYHIALLFTQAQFLDDLFVAGCVFFREIRQVAAAFADHLEQTATRMIIVLVQLQMFDQLVNSRR